MSRRGAGFVFAHQKNERNHKRKDNAEEPEAIDIRQRLGLPLHRTHQKRIPRIIIVPWPDNVSD
jgi:hypothetical protein